MLIRNYPQQFKLSLSKRRVRGFTLMELMIVVAIVGILSAVAFPAYTSYIQRGDRAAARTVMLEVQQFMERYYAANGRYTTDAAGTTLPTLPDRLKKSPSESPVEAKKYTVELTDPALGSFGVKATPVRLDTNCGFLTLTSTGVRGQAGPKDAIFCWK